MSTDDFATRLRRVITGIDAGGQSIVTFDGPASPTIAFGGGAGLFEIWTDEGGTLDRRAPVRDTTGDPVHLSPPASGIKLRWFTIAPESKPISYDAAFAAIGGADDRPDTHRHPGMHLTQTIDFIILIEGSVRLLLDADERVLSPGDVVVQRGTNHAWICEGDTPALLVAVLIDKRFADAIG